MNKDTILFKKSDLGKDDNGRIYQFSRAGYYHYKKICNNCSEINYCDIKKGMRHNLLSNEICENCGCRLGEI